MFGIAAVLASILLAAALPAAAAPSAGMRYFVGTWSCTYHAGATSMAYKATYAFDGDSQTLRQTASWTGGGDEDLVSYDAQRHGWTAVVLDGQGNATVMRASGSGSNHIAYRSVYPDASIAATFDRVSSTKYTTHGSVRMGGKTITSIDTCVRSAQ